MKTHHTALTVTEVRDSMIEHIRTAGIVPGERLPTERALQTLMGVSRNRIRDALAALESQGIVRRRVGSGTYLEATDSHLASAVSPGRTTSVSSDAALNVLSPFQLIEARLAFEVSLAPIVIRNATNSDLERLAEVIARSEAARTEEDFERLDTEFHHQIAVATHNTILIQFSDVIARSRQAAGWRRLKQQSTTQERRIGYQNDHQAILNALQQRDTDGLAMQLRSHLVAIQAVVLGI